MYVVSFSQRNVPDRTDISMVLRAGKNLDTLKDSCQEEALEDNSTLTWKDYFERSISTYYKDLLDGRRMAYTYDIQAVPDVD